MEFFNQAIAQVRELFNSMTPASRITTGLLVAVVAISLAYLVNHQVSGTDEYLMGGERFNIGQLSKMQAALGDANLAYEMDGARIKIPRGRGHEYMAALGKAGALPVTTFGSYLREALDQGGPFETKQQKSQRIKLAREQELAAIIRKWEGIEEAAVFYDVHEERGLNPKTSAKALVAITPLVPEAFGNTQVAHLRNLVAGAYDALRPENVTVTVGGRTYSGTGEDGMSSAMDDPIVSRKEHYEQTKAEQIRHALSYIPDLVVAVSAELDSSIRKSETIVKHDPQAIPVHTTIVNKSKEKGVGTAGGPAGRRPNTAGSNDPARVVVSAGAQSVNKESEEQEINVNVTNKTVTSTDYHGYRVLSAKATIAVPRSYAVQVWLDQNKNNSADPNAEGEVAVAVPTKEELNQINTQIEEHISSAVAPLLPPVGAGNDDRPNVTVVTLWDLPAQEIESPSVTTTMLSWTGRNWSTLSMMGLAVFSLVALRSMVKSAPVTETPGPDTFAAPELSVVADDEDDEEGVSKPKRKFVRGPSVKDDLAEMVREDPDAAASILRGWISNAG